MLLILAGNPIASMINPQENSRIPAGAFQPVVIRIEPPVQAAVAPNIARKIAKMVWTIPSTGGILGVAARQRVTDCEDREILFKQLLHMHF